MIDPEQYDTVQGFPAFIVAAERLEVCKRVFEGVSIPAFYDDTFRLTLQLDDFVELTDSLADDASATLRLPGDARIVKLILTTITSSFSTGKVSASAILQRSPLVFGDLSNSVKSKALILSLPKMIVKPLILESTKLGRFEILPFSSKGGAGSITFERKGSAPSDPLECHSEVIEFLTFMKGAHCGVGHMVGYGADGSTVCEVVGFSKSDNEKRQTNWFDFEVQKEVPEVFHRFSLSMQDDLESRAMRQTIAFYRASNASRLVSLEMSIVAAHSALEAVVNYILEHKAGWSSRLTGERSGVQFSEKMRAAAAYFGLSVDPLEHSPNLLSFKPKGVAPFKDGFEIISFFRNKLVHQDKDLVLTGVQLFEVWSVTQWLVEVLIFGVIGYRGTMIDRRRYTGWRGGTTSVPLTR